MREDDSSNWLSKWEEELPAPEELMPLSQSLITPDLALAFNISPPPQPNSSAEFDSGGGSDEPARTLKRPRLVWTPQLHKRFVDAVAHLGIKNAVPKTIMQLMSVDGLTRENVASHLQKYRLYLKRMQTISNGGGGANAAAAAMSDPATDHLFASSPVPPHFLHPGRPNSEHYMPFVPHHQMAVVTPHHHHPQQFRHFGSSPPNGQFEHPFMRQHQLQRIGTPPVHNSNGGATSYMEDLEPPTPANGRKVLTLFPTGDD